MRIKHNTHWYPQTCPSEKVLFFKNMKSKTCQEKGYEETCCFSKQQISNITKQCEQNRDKGHSCTMFFVKELHTYLKARELT